jgi:hypothetical protein
MSSKRRLLILIGYTGLNYKKMALIPKTGAWVLISREIPVEIPIDPMSLYFAIPSGELFWKDELTWRGACLPYIDDDGPEDLMGRLGMRHGDFDDFKKMIYNFYRSRKKEAEFESKHLEKLEQWDELGIINEDCIEQQVKIKTAFGDVCVQPHEYRIVREIDQYIEPVKDKHAFMRFLSGSKSLSGKIADQVFYLRSRGIGFAEAVQLCIQNVKTQNLFYIEMHPGYQEAFTRNWEAYWARKMKYCLDNNRMDLLDYGPSWDFSKVEPSKAKTKAHKSKKETQIN